MITALRLFSLLIICTTVISCSVLPVDSQVQVTATLRPPSFTPTPKPSATATPLPSLTPSPTSIPVCIASTSATDGWNCLNQSYGFTIHFPSTAGLAGTTNAENDSTIVWLENSPSNPHVDRMLSIILGKKAESCISSDLETIQIGEHEFIVNHGFEPSGVVYEWRSYAITKESKRVCFWFTVGFRTWEKDDPLFPPEKDQGLDELEAILATFRWLNP